MGCCVSGLRVPGVPLASTGRSSEGVWWVRAARRGDMVGGAAICRLLNLLVTHPSPAHELRREFLTSSTF